jgi:class 3 adenylate cyclase/ligand-binding sensor domain-containing protein
VTLRALLFWIFSTTVSIAAAQFDFVHDLKKVVISPDSAIQQNPKNALPFRCKEGLRHNISILGRQENLDINQVMSLCMDQRSNIWIGGYNGEIIRFDGYRFHSYSIAPLFAHPIEDILEDSQGNIWFGSRAGGIVKYDGIDFDYYGPQDGFSFKIFSFSEDPSGIIWCCTNGDGLIGIKEEKFCVLNTESGLVDNAITSVLATPNELWIGYFRDGLSRFSAGKADTTSYQGIADSTVFSLLETEFGLLAGTRRGLSFLPKHQHTFIDVNMGVGFLDLCHGRNAEVLAASNGQGLLVYEYNPSVGWVQKKQHTTENGLSSDRITNVIYDHEGNTWMGTYDFGLNLLRPQLYDNYTNENGLVDGRIWSLGKRGDEVLAGYSSTGHARILPEPTGIRIVQALVDGPLKDFTSTEIFISSNGTVWYAAGRTGVYAEKDGQLTFYPFSQEKNTQGIKAIAECKNGKVLFGSWNGLLEIRNDTLQHVEFSNGTILHNINDIRCDEDGNIWIASDAGVIGLTATADSLLNQLTYLRIGERISKNGLACQSILPLDGEIWLGTDGGGLIVFDSQAALKEESGLIPYEIIGLNEGLPDLFVMALFHDQEHLWAGTKKGICRLDQRGNKDQAWKWTVHGRNQGLLEDDIVFNNVISDAFGRIWWCTNSSLSLYFPDRIVDDPSAPIVSLDELQLFFENINWSKNATEGGDVRIQEKGSYLGSILSNYIWYKDLSRWNFLPDFPVFSHDQNHLTFHFSAREWHDPGTVRYLVKMKGMDNNWIDLGNTTYITYSGLNPGEYVFEVKAINGNQVESTVLSYPFVVMPPYWQTKWFIGLMILLLLLSFYLFYRWRVKKIERERDILEIKVDERTEELRLEKNKSEKLLLNILPRDTVDELKSKGKSEAKNFSEATVLFSDFSGFTAMTSSMEPQQLVDTLDSFFNAFDEIADKYGIEKIKTIGDSYMCACGIPTSIESHALRMSAFALEMLAITDKINAQRYSGGKEIWPVRIGLHSGPVIAGVVGKKKFAYDIWGDTVNTASRMEGNGEPGRINVSQTTALLIKDYFYIAPRGKVNVKGKGEMDMYWIESFKTPYRYEGDKRIPNSDFLSIISSESKAD